MKKLTILLALLFVAFTAIPQTDTVVKKKEVPKTFIVAKSPVTDSVVKNIDKVSPQTLKSTVIELNNTLDTANKVISNMNEQLQTKSDSLVTLQKKIKDSADEYLFNYMPVEFYFWGMFFVLLGVIASWALKSLFGMSDKKNITSTKWDWSEFLKPYNVKRRVASFTASFILAFFTIRFSNDWFGQEATMAYCAGVGLTLDLIIAWYWSKRQKFAPNNVQDNTNPNQPPVTPPNL